MLLNPERSIAYGGALPGDVDYETQFYGLADLATKKIILEKIFILIFLPVQCELNCSLCMNESSIKNWYRGIFLLY